MREEILSAHFTRGQTESKCWFVAVASPLLSWWADRMTGWRHKWMNEAPHGIKSRTTYWVGTQKFFLLHFSPIREPRICTNNQSSANQQANAQTCPSHVYSISLSFTDKYMLPLYILSSHWIIRGLLLPEKFHGTILQDHSSFMSNWDRLQLLFHTSLMKSQTLTM